MTNVQLMDGSCRIQSLRTRIDVWETESRGCKANITMSALPIVLISERQQLEHETYDFRSL